MFFEFRDRQVVKLTIKNHAIVHCAFTRVKNLFFFPFHYRLKLGSDAAVTTANFLGASSRRCETTCLKTGGTFPFISVDMAC